MKINAFCMEHRTCPVFPHPYAIDECLDLRTLLLIPFPESELNAVFGVEHWWDYKPPVYELPPSGEPEKPTVRKLDTVARHLTGAEREELEELLDIDRQGDFSYGACTVLRCPWERDYWILKGIVPDVVAVSGEQEEAEKHNDAAVEAFLRSYEGKFAAINAFCTAHGMQPFFPDTCDFTRCLEIRADLVERTYPTLLSMSENDRNNWTRWMQIG